MPRKYYRRKTKKTGTALTKKRILDIVHKGTMKTPIFKFTRWARYFDGSNYQIYSDTTPQFYSLTFDLSQVPAYTEFTDLYDQYCITQVDAHFYSIGTSQVVSTSTGPSANYISNLLTVLDYDDASTPTSVDQMLQYNTLKIHDSTMRHIKISLKPRVANEVFKSVTSGYSMGESGQWIDCASDTVPHFALKVGVTEATGPTASVRWNVFFKYHLQFRNTR